MGLGGLAPVFEAEDKRCVFLTDKSGNAYTFFKYKAKLIDLSAMNIELNIGKRDKADIM